jgi:pimeloyl-ACP methyl ester carboxylesterase
MKRFVTVLLGTVISCTACAAVPATKPATGAAATTAAGVTRLVKRDGRNISFHVIPGKLPAIVLDAGGGNDSTYWASIAPEIAKRTGARVITYDRAGFGQSDNVPGPWSLVSAIDDLEAGLRALGATKGTVLVSHSLAGEIATGIMGRHPAWFAGGVMVDANVPEFYTDEMIARQISVYTPMLAQLRGAPSTPANRQILALVESFEPVSRAFYKMEWPASVPVTVIVAATPPMPDPADAQAWRDAHALFASKAPNRKLITADRSSHDVAHDRADLVLSSIVAIYPRRR